MAGWQLAEWQLAVGRVRVGTSSHKYYITLACFSVIARLGRFANISIFSFTAKHVSLLLIDFKLENVR